MKIILAATTFFLSLFFSVAQEVKLISEDHLESLLKTSKAEITVVNFWATWCAPCIKELPYFEAINKQEGIQVILISMDYPEENEKVAKFVMKKKLESPVYQINVKDYDAFMRKISENWSGAIPATLFIKKNGTKYFHETAFTEATLNSTIANYLK